MNPYPGTELALRQANGDRAAARQLMREAILAGAEQEVSVAGRSMKCGWGKHAPDRHGCENDGSGCICECHDTPAGPYTPEETK